MPPAYKRSSTTPPCAAPPTSTCSAPWGSSPSTGSPPPKPAPANLAEPKDAGSKRASSSRTKPSLEPTRPATSCNSLPAAGPSASPKRTTPASSSSLSSGARGPTRPPDQTGRYRWYNDFALPAEHGGGTITVRLHGNDEDVKRRFNRTENVRPIPPTDPDFTRLFRIRNDAESINRGLDDTLYLRRAHSVGHRRQLVNLLGWAIMVNSVAIREHPQHAAEPAA